MAGASVTEIDREARLDRLVEGQRDRPAAARSGSPLAAGTVLTRYACADAAAGERQRSAATATQRGEPAPGGSRELPPAAAREERDRDRADAERADDERDDRERRSCRRRRASSSPRSSAPAHPTTPAPSS